MPAGKPAGCLMLFIFIVLEMAVGAAAGIGAYFLLEPLFVGRLPFLADDGENIAAIVIAVVVACLPVFLLDLLCRRLTGNSAVGGLLRQSHHLN